jgi:hypothetical protein
MDSLFAGVLGVIITHEASKRPERGESGSRSYLPKNRRAGKPKPDAAALDELQRSSLHERGRAQRTRLSIAE